MATVNRPPFWVPRPPDDNIWQFNVNYMSSAAIQQLTHQKFFGAGGQVPTKRWLPIYTDNEPPEWQGAPIHSQPLVLTTTELKWYAAPGQVPTRRWLPVYTYDDPPPWQPTPENLNSAVIQQLTHQQVFGQGGQVPPSRWNFNYDETPVWQPLIEQLSSNDLLILLTSQHFFGAGGQAPAKSWAFPFSYDDPPMWQGSPTHSQSIVLTTTQQKIFGQSGQVPPARWNFNYDETGSWQWPSYERNRNVLQPVSAQNPFSPVLWRFNYDETPVWTGTPVATNIEFIPQNMPRAAFYALRPGEEHFWQPATVRNINLYPAVTAQNPFIPVPWRFNYDDATPVEFWKPFATNATFTLSSFVEYAPRNNWQEWFAEIDDPPVWQWSYHRNLNINTVTTTAAPVVPQIWPFRTFDDDVGWVGKSIATNINFIPQNMPRAAFWALRAGFDTEWVGTPISISMSMNPPLPPPAVGPGVYNTILLSIPGGMFSIPGDPPS